LSRAASFAWSDEFDGPAGSPPDPRWWRHEVGAHGWGNEELQRYTDDPANAAHDGQGNLLIRACRDGNGYTSARLRTKGLVEFTYGRVECRLCLPTGSGLWSAVWALGADIDEAGWPTCGEIDILENVGQEPTRAFGTIHCPRHFGEGGLSGEYVARRPLAEGFHVFAVDWLPGSITWSLDGHRYFAVSVDELGSSWVFDHPFYILLNLAVGGSLGGRVGRETAFPAELKIDYLRLYRNSATAQGASPWGTSSSSGRRTPQPHINRGHSSGTGVRMSGATEPAAG